MHHTHIAILNYLQPLQMPSLLSSADCPYCLEYSSSHPPVLCLLHHPCEFNSYSFSKTLFRKYIFKESFPDHFYIKIWFIALSFFSKTPCSMLLIILKNKPTLFCNSEILKVRKINNLHSADVRFFIVFIPCNVNRICFNYGALPQTLVWAI